MTTDDFRSLALKLPEAIESSHMGHPDFRVGGKIFATIAPDGERGMVKLKPEDQEALLREEPDTFTPDSGAWGHGGSTMVDLAAADELIVRQALISAWRNTAPKKLVERTDEF